MSCSTPPTSVSAPARALHFHGGHLRSPGPIHDPQNPHRWDVWAQPGGKYRQDHRRVRGNGWRGVDVQPRGAALARHRPAGTISGSGNFDTHRPGGFLYRLPPAARQRTGPCLALSRRTGQLGARLRPPANAITSLLALFNFLALF